MFGIVFWLPFGCSQQHGEFGTQPSNSTGRLVGLGRHRARHSIRRRPFGSLASFGFAYSLFLNVLLFNLSIRRVLKLTFYDFRKFDKKLFYNS